MFIKLKFVIPLLFPNDFTKQPNLLFIWQYFGYLKNIDCNPQAFFIENPLFDMHPLSTLSHLIFKTILSGLLLLFSLFR